MAYKYKLLGGDVEVGDRDSSIFRPHLYLSRWEDECFLQVEYETAEIGEHLEWEEEYKDEKGEDKKRIRHKWQGAKIDFDFYPVDEKSESIIVNGIEHIFTQNKLGGFEFQITLKEKPIDKTLTLKLKSKNLTFYYQPPLHSDHPTWKSNGVTKLRPANVVGSYAVYHATKINMHRGKEEAEKYKTGKAFHIYRPRAKDFTGKETWCELKKDNNSLNIIIPQDFLDSAIYPIVIDPTFGYELEGFSILAFFDMIVGSVFTITQYGTADNITWYGYYTDSGTAKAKCAIYKHSNLSFVGSTEEIVGGSTPDWNTHNFTTKPNLIRNTEYILVLWGDGIFCSLYYDDGETNQGHYQSITYNSWPDPLVPTHDDYVYSIYCTYTASTLPYIREHVSLPEIREGASLPEIREH